MKRIPEHIVSKIRENSDIVSVIKDYIRIEKQGSRWIGLCPFHKERTPSFSINEEKGFFYCFGCRKGGDVISFVMEIEACTYVEALEILAEKSGLHIQYEGEEDAEWQAKHKLTESLYDLYNRLSLSFHHVLLADPKGKHALEYIKKRGINDEAIVKFRVGYAPQDRKWLYRFLSSKSFSDDFLKASGLFSKTYPETSIFSDRLMFPISDIKGRIIAFGGRLLKGEGPKYINSPETIIYKKHENLFGLPMALKTIKEKSEAIVCEGYMDCISFHTAGIDNVIAPLGTAFTEGQAALLKRYASSLVISFDKDEAGAKALDKAFSICFSSGLACKVMKFDESKDASEVLEKFGAEQLKKISQSIITGDEYILEKSASMISEGGAVSKADVLKYVFSYITNIASAVSRDDFLYNFAYRLGADPNSIKEDYKQFLVKNSSREEKSKTGLTNPQFSASSVGASSVGTSSVGTSSVGTPSDGTPSDGEFVCSLIAAPEFFSKIRNEIEVQDINGTDNREAYIALEECYRSGDMSIASILSKISNENFKKLLMERINLGVYSIMPEKFVFDGLYRIKERILENKKQRLLGKIRNYSYERDGDKVSMNDLLYEKMFLDEQLARIKEERHE